MVLAGVVAVLLFALLLRHLHGNRAAVFGAVLLATDATFVLTVCFDWGPVALQILLTIAALLLLVRRRIFWGFFCLGLAVWNKALMLWIVAALGAAAVLIVPRALKTRYVPAALLGLLVGALPFVIYNVRTRGATFSENSSWDFSDLRGKAELMRLTLAGSGLFGFLVHDDHEPEHPLPPRTPLDRATYELSAATGHRRESWLPHAFLAAAAMLPLLWRTPARRPLLFGVVVFAAGWVQMAITRGAGGSVHHAALLWPFPHLAVAVAAAEISRRYRWVGVLAVALVSASSLLVLNQTYVQMRRNGGAGNWSDAHHQLVPRVMAINSPKIYLVDWGFFDTIRLVNRDARRLDWALDTHDPILVKSWIETPGAIFVAHSPGSETLEGRRAQLLETAAKLGYEAKLVDRIWDRNGRPRFQIYRFIESRQPPRPAPDRASPPAAAPSG